MDTKAGCNDCNTSDNCVLYQLLANCQQTFIFKYTVYHFLCNKNTRKCIKHLAWWKCMMSLIVTFSRLPSAFENWNSAQIWFWNVLSWTVFLHFFSLSAFIHIFTKNLPVRKDIAVMGPQSCWNFIRLSSNLILCTMIWPDTRPTATTSTAGACKKWKNSVSRSWDYCEKTELLWFYPRQLWPFPPAVINTTGKF